MLSYRMCIGGDWKAHLLERRGKSRCKSVQPDTGRRPTAASAGILLWLRRDEGRRAGRLFPGDPYSATTANNCWNGLQASSYNITRSRTSCTCSW